MSPPSATYSHGLEVISLHVLCRIDDDERLLSPSSSMLLRLELLNQLVAIQIPLGFPSSIV